MAAVSFAWRGREGEGGQRSNETDEDIALRRPHVLITLIAFVPARLGLRAAACLPCQPPDSLFAATGMADLDCQGVSRGESPICYADICIGRGPDARHHEQSEMWVTIRNFCRQSVKKHGPGRLNLSYLLPSSRSL